MLYVGASGQLQCFLAIKHRVTDALQEEIVQQNSTERGSTSQSDIVGSKPYCTAVFTRNYLTSPENENWPVL